MSLSPTEAAILAAFGASAIFAVPSPWHGPYGGRLARDFGTLIRAVCAFASGAAFAPMSSPPWALKSDREQEVREKLAKGVRLLHVKGVLIGPTMIAMASAGSPECLDRVRGALFAYEQALMQSSEFVTIILLVTAIEALSVPNATWRRRRVTKRFLEVAGALGAEAMPQILDHANFREAFGSIHDGREFLEHLYDLRSRPLHTGMVAHTVFDLSSLSEGGGMRVALASELTRWSILEFLSRPFSSLYGHPTVDS